MKMIRIFFKFVFCILKDNVIFLPFPSLTYGSTPNAFTYITFLLSLCFVTISMVDDLFDLFSVMSA